MTGYCAEFGPESGEFGSGAGFLIDVGYTNDFGTTMIVSFYTYDSMGNQVWLIGIAFNINSDTATVDFEMPVGAEWGAAFAFLTHCLRVGSNPLPAIRQAKYAIFNVDLLLLIVFLCKITTLQMFKDLYWTRTI